MRFLFRALHPLHVRWQALPGPVRGAALITLSGVFGTVMGVFIKLLGSRIPVAEVAFIRSVFAFLWTAPFVLAAGVVVLRTAHPWWHLIRGVAGSLSLLGSYYALVHLPIADATAYNFTRALFLVLLAALLLGEPFRTSRIVATVLGFGGTVIMLRPQGGLELAALVALGAALSTAFSVTSIKKLMRTEAPVTVIFYFSLASMVFTAIPAIPVWVMPHGDEIALLVIAGALGTANQALIVRAYRSADATVIAPFEYLQLLWAAGLGFLIFSDVPGIYTWLGAAVIVAANLLLTYWERRRGA